MTPSPPKWMTRFLRWYCREDLVDAVEGDLFELYSRRCAKYGKRTANWLYFFNTLHFFQPFAFKSNTPKSRLNTMDMLGNHLKIAYRSLLKTRTVSAINLVGLAIGIAGFIMMVAYVVNERSYDKFNTKADRISRVYYSYESRGATTSVCQSAFALKHRLITQYPEVQEVVRFHRDNNDATTLAYQDNIFTEEKVFFSDPEVFEVFDFKVLAGDAHLALDDANSIVMTAERAQKYFGDDDPIGKTVLYKNDEQLVVTAIVERPTSSHIDFDFLIPLAVKRQRGIQQEGYDLEKDHKWSAAWTYVLLKEASLLKAFNLRLLEDGSDLFGRVKKPRVDFYYASIPLLDIHLTSNMIGEMEVNGNLQQVYGFAVIGFLILIIACLNFINLTTAQSTARAREIGLRKVMGAHRIHLIWQFIVESILLTFAATLLGLFLLELMIPIFNDFMDQDLSIPYLKVPMIMAFLLAGAVLIGGVAGFYPSLYLSRLKPVKTLKGEFYRDNSNTSLRKIFVVGQFVVSNMLIVGILVIQSQLDYIKNKDLGFDKDQILIIGHGSKIEEQFDLFRSTVASVPGVEGTNLGYVAGKEGWVQSYNIEGEVRQEGKSMGLKMVSFDFLDFYGLEMASGRYFVKDLASDSTRAIVINEAAARSFGWTNEEAIGKKFSWRGKGGIRESNVIGVMRDANFESLYKPIKPSVFRLGFFGDVAVKLRVDDPKEMMETIAQVEESWMALFPQWPFEFVFLDGEIVDQYRKEERLSQMIQFFALLAILIACMGLFGLATFTVKKRTKEIGVRKVFGARIVNIIFLIMKGFLLLVGLSFIISIPSAYVVLKNWLQDFEYRITITPITFMMAGLITLAVAGLAILSQSWSAAKTTPINSLKDE